MRLNCECYKYLSDHMLDKYLFFSLSSTYSKGVWSYKNRTLKEPVAHKP